jgi:hypothetical protein
LAHSFQVAPFKAFDAGFLGLDEGGELLDRLLAPFGGFYAIADVLPDGPIELDQFLVGGGDDATLRSFNQRQDCGELGLESIGHKLSSPSQCPSLNRAGVDMVGGANGGLWGDRSVCFGRSAFWGLAVVVEILRNLACWGRNTGVSRYILSCGRMCYLGWADAGQLVWGRCGETGAG